MLKICFLSSMHPENDKRVFDKEALSLASVGHDITHLCPGDIEEIKYIGGIKTITYIRKSTVTSRIFHFFRLFLMARKLKVDVYHCNEVDSWAIGILLKIITRRKVVFDVHEHYPSTFAESRFPVIFRPAVEFIIRLIFMVLTPLTDAIVLAKETVGPDFLCDDKKKILVRNFTPLSAIKFSSDNKKDKSHMTMVHFGLIGKLRGWPQILDAMFLQKNKQLHLKVIGKFNDDSYFEFKNKIVELGLESRVVFLDWMPFEQAFPHLMSADIGIIAFQPGVKNHTYAMPHKMFDYMAAELAVICPEFAVEVAPIIKDSHSGILVDVSDPKKIAQELDYLTDNPDIIKEMGVNGRIAVKDKYNWESEVVNLFQMYNRLEIPS